MRSSRRPAQYRTRDISHALTNYKATREIKHSRRSASTSLENHWPLSLSIADETVLTLDVTNSTTAFHQHFRHANPKGNEQESQLEGVQLLKGYVRGDPDSKVSLARLAEDLYEGHITYRQTDDGTPTTLHFEVVQDVDAEGRMVRRTITYRDDEIIDQFPEESCLALHAPEIVSYNPFEPLIPGPLDMNDPGLGRRGTAKGKECPIAVVADYTFYNVFGDDTETVIASIVNDVDAIFRSEFGIGTPLSYLYVARTPTDPTGLGHPTNDPVQLLNQLSTVVRENNLPNLGPACLVHLMTFQNFQPTLGIAYTARSQRYGGLCSAQGYNTGLSTPLFGSTIVSRATFVSTVAHELGHGMGSDHDGSHPVPPGNPGDCTPTKPYIMHPSATNSHHSRTFSPCSKFSIEEVLSGELTCLTEQDHSNMKTAEEDEQLWTRYDAPDECEMLFPGRNYTECPFEVAPEFMCRLSCYTPERGCFVLKDKTGQLFQRSDGILCGEFGDQSQVCLNGECQKDTRSGVCDRRKPCCDPFGKLMDHQRICRNATPCTSESHCDPSAQDPDECPLKPLSPGTACVSNAGVMGVCGQDESLGKCIVEESQALEHDDHQYTDHLEGTQGLLEISHQDVKPDFLTATTESQDEVATEPMLIFAAIVLVLLGIALTWLGVRLWKSKPLTYPVRLKKYWSSGQLQSAEEGGKPLIKVAKK